MIKSTDFKPREERILGMVMYRKLALPFVPLFIRLGISPNCITSMTLCIALLTFYLILRQSFFQAALAWQLVMILDVSDGMVARRTGKTSSFGVWYDYFIDRINFFLLLVAMGIVLRHPVGWWLITCSIMLSYLTDISSLISRLQAKGVSYPDRHAQVAVSTNRPLWFRFVRWLGRNFIGIHLHIWGFIGLFLFFGITGVRFALPLITLILFVNVVYKISTQLTSNRCDESS